MGSQIKGILSVAFFIIRFIVFIAVLSLFITIASVSVHEIGHALAARHYECPYNMVVFVPGRLPNTEISCINANLLVILFGGIISTSFFSALLYFSSSGIIKYVASGIFSVGIIAAAQDMVELLIGTPIIFLLNFAGYLLLMLSIIKISMIYFKTGYNLHKD